MSEFTSLSRTRNLGKNGKRFVFTERDGKILHFLWRWKLASTATVHEAVGRPLSPYSTYKTLERLRINGLVQNQTLLEQGVSSWLLTDRGFATIRGSLWDLVEEGYGSEHPWHDRNVVAFHLGEWATLQAPMVTHLTEQEMRRRSVDYYPSWVPQSKEHRPDGYTQVRSKKKDWILAFEVELWPKAVSIYEKTLRYYELMRKIDRVYWLTGSPSVRDQILRARDCIKDQSQNFHLFVDQQDYRDRGWDALVTNEKSETLGTFRDHMQAIGGDDIAPYVGHRRGKSTVHVHYDSKKVLGKKRT